MVSIIRRRACPWPYERTSSGSILRALRFGRRPSRLSFSDGAFDVVTAVETHFWWPALPTDLREVLRVLKPRGRLIIIAVVYKGAEALGVKRCRTMLCTYWDSSVLRIIANSSAMPVTQTLRSLHNRERAGFPASGVRPQVS